jgi:predicted nucleic acid-binding protein
MRVNATTRRSTCSSYRQHVISAGQARDCAVFATSIQKILIPPEVKREAYKGPHKVKRRLQKLINEMAGFFVDCKDVDELIKDYLKADLDDGEASAIAQADYHNAVVLVDEKKDSNERLLCN